MNYLREYIHGLEKLEILIYLKVIQFFVCLSI